jgi:hypothetical protein
MNKALWSPRGARAGERTHTAGDTSGINDSNSFWLFAVPMG